MHSTASLSNSKFQKMNVHKGSSTYVLENWTLLAKSVFPMVESDREHMLRQATCITLGWVEAVKAVCKFCNGKLTFFPVVPVPAGGMVPFLHTRPCSTRCSAGPVLQDITWECRTVGYNHIKQPHQTRALNPYCNAII